MVTSVVAVTGAAAVTIAAVLTSVILNIALFASTAFSLTFKLDINYSNTGEIVAYLTGEDEEYSKVLDGDVFLTFAGLQPDKEYELKIVGEDGSVLFRKSYKTAKESSAPKADIFVENVTENDVYLTLFVFSEGDNTDVFDSFFTLTVNTTNEKKVYAEDWEFSEERNEDDEYQFMELSKEFVIKNYPFESECYATVKYDGKVIAVITLPAGMDLLPEIEEVSYEVTSSSVSAVYEIKSDYDYYHGYINGEYVYLQKGQDGETFSFVKDGLSPSSSYTVILYDRFDRAFFEKTYVTKEQGYVSDVTLTLDSREIGTVDASYSFIIENPNDKVLTVTLSGEEKELIEDPSGAENTYVLFLTDLTPGTTYELIISEPYASLYTDTFTIFQPAAEVELTSSDIGVNYINLHFTVDNPDSEQIVFEEGGTEIVPVIEGNVYTINVSDLTAGSTHYFYAYSIYEENYYQLYSGEFVTHNASVTLEEKEIGMGEGYYRFLVYNPGETALTATIDDEERDLINDGDEQAGYSYYVVNIVDITTGEDHVIKIADGDTILYTDTFRIFQSTAVVTILEESTVIGMDSISLQFQVYNPDDETLVFYLGENKQAVTVSENVYAFDATGLSPDTNYTVYVCSVYGDDEYVLYSGDFTTAGA